MSSGINFDKLHEKEVVSFRPHEPLRVSALADTLMSVGFRTMDDFCFFPRSDQRSAWQSDTVTTATFFFDGSELSQPLDEADSLCDEIRFDYLLASLPPQCIEVFISLIRTIQDLVGGPLFHLGVITDINDLDRVFALYVTDIEQELAEEPGSEFLNVCIAQSYPRRSPV